MEDSQRQKCELRAIHKHGSPLFVVGMSKLAQDAISAIGNVEERQRVGGIVDHFPCLLYRFLGTMESCVLYEWSGAWPPP